MIFFSEKKSAIPSPSDALVGRATPMPVPEHHYVNSNPLKGPYPDELEQVIVGIGCFWGAERIFWQMPGVYVTAVGYAAGHTPNPTYEEVCSGQTGHNEVVHVVYDPQQLEFEHLLKAFWQGHNPTQGMRQGNDVGTQYRSGIYCTTSAQVRTAEASRKIYQNNLDDKRIGPITTEILDAPEFYYAEEGHQQYLAKNPSGYCGLGGTGVALELKD